MSARVGVVGCGVIAKAYVEGSVAFDSFDVIACADVDAECAAAFADIHRLPVATVDALIADPSIDVVLNLTPPAAHASVIRAALEAGKHVYTEKPITTTVAEGRELLAVAEGRGLRIGSAPDIFLGAAYETARELIAEGAIGTPLNATATFLVGGPDTWHPNADVFYRAGGGPMLDIAPYYLTAIASLLGPYRVGARPGDDADAGAPLRGRPARGRAFTVDVPTHAVAALQLEQRRARDADASASRRAASTMSGLVVHGSEGSLELPGRERLRRRRSASGTGTASGSRSPYELARPAGDARPRARTRCSRRSATDRPHRASGTLALHVLETALAVLRSAEEGRTVEIGSALEPRFGRGERVAAARGDRRRRRSQQPARVSQRRQRGAAGSPVTRLVTDARDAKLVNAWGLAASPTGPWWVANEARDVSTLYAASGQQQSLTSRWRAARRASLLRRRAASSCTRACRRTGEVHLCLRGRSDPCLVADRASPVVGRSGRRARSRREGRRPPRACARAAPALCDRFPQRPRPRLRRALATRRLTGPSSTRRSRPRIRRSASPSRRGACS